MFGDDETIDMTDSPDALGEVVAETPVDEVIETDTRPDVVTAAPVNRSLVSCSVMVLRGGAWPQDYKFRIGQEPWKFCWTKELLLKALDDALPD